MIALLNKVTTTSHLRLIGVVGVGVNTTIIGIIKLLPLVNPYFLGNLEENSGKLREIRGTSGKPRETWGKHAFRVYFAKYMKISFSNVKEIHPTCRQIKFEA